MNKLAIAALGLLLFSVGCDVQAAKRGVYLGGSLGQADVSISSTANNVSFQGNDTAYKVLVGVRPLKWFAVEANYVDMGKPDKATYVAHPTGVSGFAVGYLPLGPVDLFVKGGAINWNSKVTANGIKLSSRDGTDAAYGAGVQVSVLALKIRAEYERFEVDKGANLLSVGFVFTFL